MTQTTVGTVWRRGKNTISPEDSCSKEYSVYFPLFPSLKSPEGMDKPLTEDSDEAWCSEAADATAESCPLKCFVWVCQILTGKESCQKHPSWPLLPSLSARRQRGGEKLLWFLWSLFIPMVMLSERINFRDSKSSSCPRISPTHTPSISLDYKTLRFRGIS